MGTPDFDLCDATCGRLEQLGEEPTDDLYAAAVLPWAASGAIGNGGFEHLFSGAFFDRDPGYARTLAALERVGATACAAAFREALAWLGAPPPADVDERRRRMEAVAEAERRRVAAAFWAGQPELERQLAAFIRAHATELEGRPVGFGRLGDLRYREELLLERLDGDRVVQTFDLRAWRAAVETRRPVAEPAAAAAVAVACLVARTFGWGAHGWWWLVAALAAGAYAVLAVLTARPRLWLVLRKGAEEVRLGGWDALDGNRFAFVTHAVKVTAAREVAEERTGDEEV